jgi:phage gpG-like protein
VKGDYAEVGTNVEYAPYVEYGTRNPNYRAQPFMRPAVDVNKDELNRDFQDMLLSEYKKEARRGNR